MSIINIGIIEDQKLLVMMTRGENSLFLIDYTSCKGIAKLGDLPSSQMFVFPFSKATVEAQMNLYHQAIDADALIYTSNDDGCICSGLIKSSKDKGELQCTWIPQHLYSTKVKETETDHKDSGLKILNTIWYNIILDILVVSDVSGIVYLIENSFYYTLKSNLKVPVKSDVKQPFFSIGLSSSSKESVVACLTKEKHVRKENESNQKSSLPLFSFGIFKSSSKEEKIVEQAQEEVKVKEETKEDSKVAKPAANRKRVQINKNDILSGNYNFTKSSTTSEASDQQQPVVKAKIDDNKINEILKRIERHTAKSSVAESSESKYKNLISELKENTKLHSTLPSDDPKKTDASSFNSSIELNKSVETSAVEKSDESNPIEKSNSTGSSISGEGTDKSAVKDENEAVAEHHSEDDGI